jgi:hypothetical protein
VHARARTHTHTHTHALCDSEWLNAVTGARLSEGERRAEAHKQRLLIFDRTSQQRTRVLGMLQ